MGINIQKQVDIDSGIWKYHSKRTPVKIITQAGVTELLEWNSYAIKQIQKYNDEYKRLLKRHEPKFPP
jgi:hypothetical protein